MKEKLERITRFAPAFDKRATDPKKDYGIGAVRCFMVLKGNKGAVHFVFYTGMLLASTMREYIKTGRAKYEFISPDHEWYLNKPMGVDVGYHSRKPQYKGATINWRSRMVKKDKTLPDLSDLPKDASKELRDKAMLNMKWVKVGKKPQKCEWLGVPCYCDGSAMRAEEWFNIFLEKGSDPIWEMLEAEYKLLK